MSSGLADRVVRVIEDLDLVRAADIARRCGVSRTSVMRWQVAGRNSGRSPAVLPRAHVTIGGREYWSWPLLGRQDPNRFSPGPPMTLEGPVVCRQVQADASGSGADR